MFWDGLGVLGRVKIMVWSRSIPIFPGKSTQKNQLETHFSGKLSDRPWVGPHTGGTPWLVVQASQAENLARKPREKSKALPLAMPCSGILWGIAFGKHTKKHIFRKNHLFRPNWTLPFRFYGVDLSYLITLLKIVMFQICYLNLPEGKWGEKGTYNTTHVNNIIQQLLIRSSKCAHASKS